VNPLHRSVDSPYPVPVAEVAVREFEVAAPPTTAHHAAVRPEVRSDSVRGSLVGLGDGRRWGWWGPVDRDVAARAPGLLHAAFPRLPAAADPATFARRLRRATRHAHTGLLSLTVGALELAMWDLAGRRAELPVWALLAERAARTSVPAYATCFGVSAGSARAAAVMEDVAEDFPVQKWQPDVLAAGAFERTAEFVARRGPGRLAVDFLGTWDPDNVRVACRPLSGALAWVEEPYHPDEVDRASSGEFGAPHAAGEHCYGVADAAQLRAGHVDVWQPDAVFCGGMSSLLQLVRAAAEAGAVCSPHGGGLLPALHLAVLGEPIATIELHLLLEPRRCAHLATPPRVDGGELDVPCAPGWSGDIRTDIADG